MKSSSIKPMPIATMPMNARHYGVLVVCSMEQIIGTTLSAMVGIVLPMIGLMRGHDLPSSLQGLVGAIGLIGIAIGSAVIGRISDKKGYANMFRLCPLLIAMGMLLPFLFQNVAMLIIGLGIAGIGIGGGYSLDSSYISELMPAKWRLFMVGVAKASCAIGFILMPLCALLILRHWPDPGLWHWLPLIVGGLGLIGFLLRLRYPDSPQWLIDHGRTSQAQKAAKWFFGPDAEVLPQPVQSSKGAPATWGDMFRGGNLKKVIFSGIPWACEGVGVYGIGVFLPVLIMALGIDHSNAEGMGKIVNSVELTTIINCFILPGFALGLMMARKVWHVRMLTQGFIWFSAGVALVLAAYLLHWPLWVSIAGFITFEIALNAGPHLITFIIPSQIYPVDERGAGAGIAAMLGKIGAIVGVFLMPVLLRAGGITLVLIICIAVGLAGALISIIYGRKVLPQSNSQSF